MIKSFLKSIFLKEQTSETYSCYGKYPFLYPQSEAENNCEECPKGRECVNASSNKKFLIGQRVVCNGEIGKTVKSETGMTSGVWVYLESKGYSSDYDLINVSELPNGKL